MKFSLVNICVFVTFYHFTSSTPIPKDEKMEINPNTYSSNPTTALPVSLPIATKSKMNAPQGRNIKFEDQDEELLMFSPLQDNYADLPVNQEPVLVVDPTISHPLDFDDNGPIDQDTIIIPQPSMNLENLPAVLGVPSDGDDEEDMETAAQIVFRPLFAYRKQTAQRRRVYSKPSSTTNNGYGQRRQQNYYPSYGYGYYPRNYDKGC